jgi:hypothetical protein
LIVKAELNRYGSRVGTEVIRDLLYRIQLAKISKGGLKRDMSESGINLLGHNYIAEYNPLSYVTRTDFFSQPRSGARMQPTAPAVGGRARSDQPRRGRQKQNLEGTPARWFDALRAEQHRQRDVGRCMRQNPSPCWGSPSLVADPRLTPWAAFLRRFAASYITVNEGNFRAICSSGKFR